MALRVAIGIRRIHVKYLLLYERESEKVNVCTYFTKLNNVTVQYN